MTLFLFIFLFISSELLIATLSLDFVFYTCDDSSYDDNETDNDDKGEKIIFNTII